MINNYHPEGVLYETSENQGYIASISGLLEAYRDGAVAEAKPVMCTSAHELVFDFGGYTVLMPKDECEYTPGRVIKDIAVISRVNKPTSFIVDSIDPAASPPRITISRREAQRRFIDYAIKNIVPGDVIPAKVTHLDPFGAFVDVGCGVISLISTENISVSRISHPSCRFNKGQNILVVVKSVQAESGRFFISHKELLGTWEENASRFSPGQTVMGIIRSREPYGIFVELAPNLVGLCEYQDDAEENQTAAVYIKSIIPEKMKIKLVIVEMFPKSVLPDPFDYFVYDHIDYWRYTPTGYDKKTIEQYF